jgi:acetyltransferase-like isoleucine patch superfamily enzyme
MTECSLAARGLRRGVRTLRIAYAQRSPQLRNSYCDFEVRASSATIHRSRITHKLCVAHLRFELSRVDPNLRTGTTHDSAPAHLQENVLVCASIMVLKGVAVGRNSVIAAGSVVVFDIPDDSVAGGVPARVVASLRA